MTSGCAAAHAAPRTRACTRASAHLFRLCAQELVSEYTAAAPACRTGRRFRLKVYLTRAEAEVYTDDDFFSEMCPFQEEDSSR